MTSEEIFKESAEYLAGKLEERKNELVLKLPEIYITDVRAAYYAGLKSGLRHHSHDYLVKTEPREKRIAELEAQIERNKIDLAISEHDREHNDYELTEAYKKIEQLEKENAELKQAKEGKIVEHFEAYGQCRDSRRIAELEAQIEKMKNCKNCKKLKKEKDGLLICTVGSFYTNVFGKNCDKWEIKEK